MRSLFSVTPLFLIVLVITAPSHADTDAHIDRSFTYKMNILADAAPAEVTLHVTGDSMKSPFKWSVTIKDMKGRVVLLVNGDDGPDDTSWFDSNDLVKDCHGYETCKSKWYFKDLPGTTPKLGNFVQVGHGRPVEDWQERSLQPLADAFLEKKGLSKAQRQAVIKEMHGLMEKGGYGEFSPIRDPVEQGQLYMYVPSLGYFVPFWED